MTQIGDPIYFIYAPNYSYIRRSALPRRVLAIEPQQPKYLVLLRSIAGLGYKSSNGKSAEKGADLIVLHVVGESLPAG